MISGLDLNLDKTVVIPLWEEAGDQKDGSMSSDMKKARVQRISGQLEEAKPFWGNMDVSFSGKYLGFEEGPGKGEKTWDKASEKYT